MGVSLKITNNSGHKVYYLVWGLNDGPQPPAPTPYTAPWCYLNSSGDLVPFPTPKPEKGAYVDFTSQIPSMEAGAEPIVFDNLPHIWSGQVFFSFDAPPKLFRIVPSWDANGHLAKDHGGFGVQTPSFMPNNLDTDTLFSASEFTFDSTGMYADTTCVDHFTAPITVRLDGTQFGQQSSGELKVGVSREDVFTAFSSISNSHVSMFKKLVMTDGSANVRVLAPGHGVTTGDIPSDYYDKYVAHCWSVYSNQELTIDIPAGDYKGTYIGKVSGDVMTFYNAAGGQVGTITKPSAQDIFLCNGLLLATNDLQGALRARIGAAFNRTVLHNQSTQPYCRDFYSTVDEDQTWWATNWYSKLLHAQMQKVYAFPFDDVCENNNTKPLLQDSDPKLVEFELASWTATKS